MGHRHWTTIGHLPNGWHASRQLSLTLKSQNGNHTDEAVPHSCLSCLEVVNPWYSHHAVRLNAHGPRPCSSLFRVPWLLLPERGLTTPHRDRIASNTGKQDIWQGLSARKACSHILRLNREVPPNQLQFSITSHPGACKPGLVHLLSECQHA